VRGGITARVLVAGALLAVIVGTVFVVLVHAVVDARQSADLAARSRQVLASADGVLKLVIDMETGARGFVLTGDPRFLEPWQSGRAAVPGALDEFRRLPLQPEQQRVAEAIAGTVTAYVQDYSVPLITAAQRGATWPRGLDAALDGKQRVDALRSDFDRFSAAQRQIVTARDARSAQAAHLAIVVGAAGATGSVVLIAVFTGYLTGAIVRPVRRAAGMADRLAGGDLAARIPEDGTGEIRTLQGSFNEMGRSLERNRDELSRLVAEQSALRRVATLVAHGASPPRVFTAVTEEAGLVLGADGTRLVRFEADGTATVVAGWGRTGPTMPVGTRVDVAEDDLVARTRRDGQVTRVDHGAAGMPGGGGTGSAVGVPVVVEGQLWGVMAAFAAHDTALPDDVEARFAGFTDLAATAISNSQARADLLASRARVVAAGDQMRRRIERDLHDGTQQRLVSLMLDLRTTEAGVPPEQAELRIRLATITGGLDSALDDLREISRGIHPAILSEGGLAPAVRALARRSTVPVRTGLDIDGRLPEPVEVAAYYVVAEALANAAKHARASMIEVGAALVDGRLCLSVRDNGVGGADPARGSGLVGLTDRVEALGGSLVVDSPPGGGTRLAIELPVQAR
jgi:signal transduction histidine kinase